jgi:putative membrane protein
MCNQSAPGEIAMNVRTFPVSGILLVLAACGSGGDSADNTADTNVAVEADTAMPASNAAAPDASSPLAPADYAAAASASDMFEIESSRLAADKGQNPDVKALARMLIADHQKSTTDLKAAASQAQPPIDVSPALDAEQQANIQTLRGLNGADFDRVFLQQQVAAHQKALDLVQGYSANGDVPSLKKHASAVTSPVKQHLERSRELLDKGSPQ